MRVRRSSLLALTPGLLLGACHYESPVPLGEPDPTLLDARLSGYWIAVAPESQDTSILLVIPFSDRELLVEVDAPIESLDSAADERVREHFRGFATELEGARFMNLERLQEEDRPYLLFRYELLPGDTLIARALTEDMVDPPLASTPELRDFLRRNIDNPAIYDSAMVFMRPQEESSEEVPSHAP